MNKHGNLKCSACGSEDIRMHIYYDGADWLSAKGEGSRFYYGVDLVCEDCGRAYPVCRVNNEFSVCALREPKKQEEKIQ